MEGEGEGWGLLLSRNKYSSERQLIGLKETNWMELLQAVRGLRPEVKAQLNPGCVLGGRVGVLLISKPR